MRKQDMIGIILIEFKKQKRLKILLVGIISIVISQIITNVQVSNISQMSPDFAKLLDMCLWNDATIMLPFTFALIGGYLINREYTEGTMKNILTVPIGWAETVKAKIVVEFIFVFCLVIFNTITLLFSGIMLGENGVNLLSTIHAFISILIVHFCLYIGVLPLILFFSKSPGGYIWGPLFSMIMGVMSIFIANGKLVNYSPIMTGFSFISNSLVQRRQWGEVKSAIVIMLLLLLSYGIYSKYYKERRLG